MYKVWDRNIRSSNFKIETHYLLEYNFKGIQAKLDNVSLSRFQDSPYYDKFFTLATVGNYPFLMG